MTAGRTYLSLALFGLSFALHAGAARADDSTELEALLEQKIVTSASKSAETTETAPATAFTVTADELRLYGLRSVAEAIRFLVPGAVMEETPGGSFGGRGVMMPFDFGSHVLVLVDGQSVNSELDGSSDMDLPLGVPIELVDHVEVVLGPGSVLYGSNAMFGVVNVVTKRAKDQRGLKLGADAEVSRRYRGAVIGGREFTLFDSTGEFVVGLEYITMHDPIEVDEQFVGNDVYTGMPLQTRADGSMNGVWGGTFTHNESRQFAGYARASLGDFAFALRLGREERNDPSQLFDFDAADTGFDNRWLSANLTYQKRLSTPLELRLRLYGDERRRDFIWRSSAPQYCLPGQLQGCVVDTRGGAESLGLEAQLRIDWVGGGSQSTLLGIDGRVRNNQYASDIIDTATGENPGTVAYWSKVEPVLAAYAQHVAELGPKVALNLGARLDAYPDTSIALSPRAALVYQAWSGASIKAIYSSAFQAPLTSVRAFAQPLLVIPAGELDNERVNSYELGYTQRLGTQVLSTNLFYSRWRQMVELVKLSESELNQAKVDGSVVAFVPNAYQYRNAAEIESYGISAYWEGTSLERRLRYGLSVTESYSRSQRESGDVRGLQGAPSLTTRAHVSYDFEGPWPSVALSALAMDSVLVYNVDEGGFSVPPTVDPRIVGLANVEGPFPGLAGLRYRLGVRAASSRSSANAIGTLKSATPENPEPVLFPLRPFTVLGGLEYSLD